jgi:1-acyl-sn-glycerol-3-phosphate acyltransferase
MAFNLLLKATLGVFLKLFFRVESRGREIFKKLRPPYLLIASHGSALDPFLVGYFTPRPVHWVTSDGNMRTSIMRFVLSLVGSIPKAKAIPDIETVGMIMDIARKRRGVVGIFAEGQATWNGASLPLIESTGKLVRLLKVPVVAAVPRGSYFSLPRWSWGTRRGRIAVEYRLLMDGEEAGRRAPEESLALISKAIRHDECAYQDANTVSFLGSGRAERLELALFLCPRCLVLGRMRSSGSEFSCDACGASARMDRFGFLRPGRSGGFPFTRIIDWDGWQESAFAGLVGRASLSTPLFSDAGVRLYRGRKSDPLRLAGRGSLAFFADRIEFSPDFGRPESFPLEGIEGAGVLIQQVFEFYSGDVLNQFRFSSRSASARKWQMAIDIIKRKASQS